MFPHHIEAIEAITKKLSAREEVLGVIIGGSVAHGFAGEQSDIDILIVLSDEDYEKALQDEDVGYFETESTPYEGGYVDGKMTCPAYIRKVAADGSEPARFAFQDAFVTYSKVPELATLVKNASGYPVHRKNENMEKFYAQFETWKWYYYEGRKRNNRFLMDYSLSNYILFAARLILAYNEILFPSYKWMLKVLEAAAHKPKGLIEQINRVLEDRDESAIEALYESVASFHPWYRADKHWSIRFMIDSQLNWEEGNIPIADL